jgi:hypothetical protein
VANAFVRAHSLLTRLALDDTERRDAYSALFKEPLEARVIEQIRVATNKGVCSAATPSSSTWGLF